MLLDQLEFKYSSLSLASMIFCTQSKACFCTSGSGCIINRMTSSFPLNSAVVTIKNGCCLKDTWQHLSAQDKFLDQFLLHTVYNVDAVVDCSPTRWFQLIIYAA